MRIGEMANKKSQLPVRREDLIVQKLGEEIIVYDRATHRAHSLNRSASLVFEQLDGKHDAAGIAKQLGQSLGRTSQAEIVATALNELAEANLLQPGAALPRRSLLRGLAVALIPVVATIAVPTAAAAASCAAYGDTCVYGSDCCAGLYCVQTGSFTFQCL